MKKWVYQPRMEGEVFPGIRKEVQEILRSRKVETKPAMEEFLSEHPVLTYDPFLLKGVREAIQTIKWHIENRSRICVYGDYDVDGITAVCLLTEFLENLTPNVVSYIPSRTEEGYGVNKGAIQRLHREKTDLIITVDCGISSWEEVAYAKSLGMEVIVTDHHTPGEKLAECIVINPKQPGCRYPFKELCGCGVAYKLIQAFQKTAGLPKSTIARGLDLVAIATVADIVPLVDENRTIVKHGLRRVNSRKRPGLRGLLREISLEDKMVSAEQIAFIIGPLINAGGRVDSAQEAMELLRASDAHKIRELSEKLVYNNNMRKALQARGYQEAKAQIEEGVSKGILVIRGRDIHEGIAGIVAGKLKEEYCRPVLIVTQGKEPGLLKGTGRSVRGLDLYRLLKTQEGLLENFGGHKAACGFSIREEKLEAFRKALEEETEKIRKEHPQWFEETLLIDQSLRAEDITEELVKEINALEPFGYQNEKPVFSCENLYVVQVQFMGKEKEHVRLYTRDHKGHAVECVMFGAGKQFREWELQGNIIDVAGVLNMNRRGRSYHVQFVLEDIRKHQEKERERS